MVTKGGALGEDEALIGAVERLKAPPARAEALPLLGMTTGDPCGIGPEVLVKALNYPEVYRICRPLVIGHPEVVRGCLKFAEGCLEVRSVESPEEGAYRPYSTDEEGR